MGRVIEFKAGSPEDTRRRGRISRRRRCAGRKQPSSVELLAEALASLAQMKAELMVTFEQVSHLRAMTKALTELLCKGSTPVVWAAGRRRHDVHPITGAL